MLNWANNTAQPIADEVETADHEVTVADGTALLARWYRVPSSDSRAAAVAILSRDRSGPPLARQILLYPMLDDRNTTPDPQIAPFAGWTYDDSITGWNALLGQREDDTPIDSSAAPPVAFLTATTARFSAAGCSVGASEC
jgi:hypothetical protein